MLLANGKFVWLALGTTIFFVFFLFHSLKRRRSILLKIMAPTRWSIHGHYISTTVRIIEICLLSGFLSLALLSALRPQWGFQTQEIQKRGTDIIVLMDTSQSMLAEDVQPNRIERAKRELIDLVNMLEGDRIALIPFAGKAHIICPLTEDYEAFKSILSQVTYDLIPYPGTNFTEALSLAREKFGSEANRSKAILLLSDGGETEGSLKELLETFNDETIHIFALGIGTTEGAPIPDQSDEGGFKKDENGQVIISKLEEDLLQDFALKTNGVYVRSVTSDLDLIELYKKGIRQKLKAYALETKERIIPTERYQLFLSFALVLLFICPFLYLTHSRSKLMMIGFLLLILLPKNLLAYSLLELERGNQSYQDKKFKEAQQHYQNHLEDHTSKKAEYNLGNAYYSEKDYSKALDHYQKSLQSDDASQMVHSLYNIGNTYYRLNRLEDSIKAYENTLAIDPDHKKAQANLEFVKRKLEEQKQQDQQDKDKQDQQDKDKQDQQDKDKQDQQDKDKQDQQDKDKQDQQDKDKQDQQDKDKQDQQDKDKQDQQDKDKQDQQDKDKQDQQDKDKQDQQDKDKQDKDKQDQQGTGQDENMKNTGPSEAHASSSQRHQDDLTDKQLDQLIRQLENEPDNFLKGMIEKNLESDTNKRPSKDW